MHRCVQYAIPCTTIEDDRRTDSELENILAIFILLNISLNAEKMAAFEEDGRKEADGATQDRQCQACLQLKQIYSKRKSVCAR